MLDFTQTLHESEPLIHPTCTVKNCAFGRYVELGDHCVVEDTRIGDYTYLFGSNDVIYSEIGKFNSIATGVPTILPTAAPITASAPTTRRCSSGGGTTTGWSPDMTCGSATTR